MEVTLHTIMNKFKDLEENIRALTSLNARESRVTRGQSMASLPYFGKENKLSNKIYIYERGRGNKDNNKTEQKGGSHLIIIRTRSE